MIKKSDSDKAAEVLATEEARKDEDLKMSASDFTEALALIDKVRNAVDILRDKTMNWRYDNNIVEMDAALDTMHKLREQVDALYTNYNV